MMIIGFIGCLLVMAIAGNGLIKNCTDGYDFKHLLAGIAGTFLLAFSGIGGLIGLVAIPAWYGSEVKASIINREYGTNYTQKEIFFASDVIDTIRQIKRTRIEATVNVNKDK